MPVRIAGTCRLERSSRGSVDVSIREVCLVGGSSDSLGGEPGDRLVRGGRPYVIAALEEPHVQLRYLHLDPMA